MADKENVETEYNVDPVVDADDETTLNTNSNGVTEPHVLSTIYSPSYNALTKLLSGQSAKRVIKVGKNLKGYYVEYSIDKLLRWNHSQKKAKQRNYWVDIESPSEQDMDQLGEKFRFHPLTVEEILHPDTREKVEIFEERKYMFIAAKELHYQKGSNELVSVNLNMVIFHNLVLTFHYGEVIAIDYVLNKIRQKVLETTQYSTGTTPASNYPVEDDIQGEKIMETSDWTVYAILNALAQMFERYVTRVVLEGDALDELVLVFNSGEQNDLLRRIGMARRLLNYVRTALRAKIDILNNLATRDYNLITKGIRLYLRDVQGDSERLDERLSLTKDTLNNLHQTYLARLSIEEAELANRAGRVMKLFSAVATIFIPLNFLSSLFGMNVKIPYQQNEESNSLAPFFTICAGMLTIALVIVGIFSVRKWW